MFSSLTPSTASVASAYVKDVSLTTLKAEVLEASKTALVLMVFHATWEPSCKQLLAVLEKLSAAAKGTVRVAKIDIDKEPAIAQQMGVQSVPSVFAFSQGRPVDGFAGALPEAQVKTWLDQMLKNTGVGAPEQAGLDTALEQASDMIAAGDIATARAVYVDILSMQPDNAPSQAGLVRCLLEEGEVEAARAMLDATEAAIAKDKAFDPVRAALELAEQVRQSTGRTAELEAKLAQDENDHQTRFDLALALYAVGHNEQAIDQLLEIVRRARSWNEDAARKQLVKFFEAFGNADPLTISGRRRLSSILFS